VFQLRSRDDVANADTGWLRARHHFAIGHGVPVARTRRSRHYERDRDCD